MLSSDALSSIAYGPEQVILVFSQSLSSRYLVEPPLSVFLSSYLLSLTISIVKLSTPILKVVGLYGHSGKSLPELGLIAGGSLLVDYMLTVAYPLRLELMLLQQPSLPSIPTIFISLFFLVCLLMLLNLRGLKESASSLMIPVYLFIFSTVFLLLLWVLSTIHRFPKLSGDFNHWTNRSEPFHRSPIESLYQWLCLSDRVEAISNAVPFFKTRKKRMLLRP